MNTRNSCIFVLFILRRRRYLYNSSEIMAKIIGRKQEVEELLRLYNRPENQLVTVRGYRIILLIRLAVFTADRTPTSTFLPSPFRSLNNCWNITIFS